MNTAPASSPASQTFAGGYGMSITLVEAKTCAAAAAAHAADIGVPMVIAVTDAAGQLLYLERMDGAIAAGIQVAQDKARCAALYKRATKVFEDALLSPNGQRFMSLAGVVPVEGGVILIRNGQLVGAIGVSGGTGHQDGQVAQAGASALAA